MDEITTQLKKMLLSQNTVFQDKSIQFMIRSLKDPKQFNLVSRTYLDADMIQFLCEPLLSINTPLIQSICICIWMLSKNDTFYKRNDVLYTCNSLLRTLVFLIRTSDALVSDLIQLLAIIIKKGGTNLQEICNIPQVLTIIKMVFTNSQNLPALCVINAISMLTYFLSCPSIELSNKLYNTSMYISKAICKSVTGKCIIDPHVVDIASNLSSSLLRLYSTITKRVSLNENLKKHIETAKLFKNVAWYMIKHISLPFVQKNLNINIYCKSYRKAIKNLLSPFKESLSTSARQNISSHYAASRIISILYELIEYNKIGILAEELLFEILFYLSSAYLEINHHWPGGIDMFRNQMVWSFKNFPKTPKDLCFVLTNSTNIDTKHLIIIFIYFYLLTCSNNEKESMYLEPICDYLCSIQNEIPIPIIKAVLFNISICFVSHHAVNAISGLTFATKKLVELINFKTTDLIFTHHPALLYFLFASSIIPKKIQIQLIKQWIQNSDEICLVELEKFCLNNHKAKLCLMNVLINDTNIDSNKLQAGFNIIKKIITTENECNEHKTLLIIWDMLPIYLGSFCCTNNQKGIGATNLTFLLNLTEPCSLRGPNISINEHRSIVYTMSSIIKIHQSTFTEQYSLLSSLLQHLLTLIQLSNSDVLNTVKKNKDFLYALEKLCLSKNDNICFLAINTVIQLCQLEQEETVIEHKLLYSITLKCEYILNAMSRLSENCIISSIILFKIILQYYEEGICKSVEFTETPSVDFLKTIFLQLETIISQGLDRMSDHAWECMTTILSTKLLKHLQKLTYLKIEFATDPWLNFILVNSKSFSERCLEFLYFWFRHFVINDEDSFTIRGLKVLCPSLFDNTIVHISVTLINQVYEKNELVSKAKSIIQLILENKFLLPDELKGKMNIFLNQN